MSRAWTTTEERYVRDHYVLDGADAVGMHLNRSLSAVYNCARRLGLQRQSAEAARERAKWSTSEFIDAAIRRAYQNPKKGFVNAVAQRVSRPPRWVGRRAAQLGLQAPRFKEPAWSAEEYRIIEENAHRTLTTICRILAQRGFKRTEAAVSIKLIRRGVDRLDYDHVTATGLAQLMGVDAATVVRWIERDWLKAKRRGTHRTESQGDQWWIHRRDVRRFVVDNAAAVDLRKIADKFWFIDIMAGDRKSERQSDAA